MLEEPNIKTVFGDWKAGAETDRTELKKFGFRGRNIILAGIGCEGSVRGLNLKNERPDIILMDDIQSREQADSKLQSEKIENWMISTLMKAKSPKGCMFLFVANMYPTEHSLLRKLKKNPTWIKFIAGGILEDGSSLWEDLQPIKQLITEFQNDLAAGKPEAFYSEVLNDENASANNLIDLSALPDYTYQEGDIPAGNFIIIDPATDKKGADANSIGYFEVHDTKPILMDLTEGNLSPGDTMREAIKFALKYNCRLVMCEGNAYQYTFIYWFEQVCKQLGISGINCCPIYSGTKSKNARILQMITSYAAGEIYVHDSCKPDVHLQVSQFNPMRIDNTDGLLDLLCYAPRVMLEFQEFVISVNLLAQQEYEAIGVDDFNSCF